MFMITDREHFKNILKTANHLYPKPKNFNSIKNLKKINKKRDLMFLSYLFTNGIPYQQLIDNLDLLEQSLSLPNLSQRHIDFIYTRDEVLFLPGRWYKFHMIDLFLMKKFYETKYSDTAFSNKINHSIRIGLLFAIYIKYQNQTKDEIRFLRNNSQKIEDKYSIILNIKDSVLFGKPLELSRFAGIISDKSNRSSNLLAKWIEDLGFKVLYFNSAIKQKHLIIYDISEFIKKYNDYKKENALKIPRSIRDEYNLSSKKYFDQFISKSIRKLPEYIKHPLKEFEFRFHRNVSFFNLKKFRGLPFIRVRYSKYIWNYKFYVPSHFLNYIHRSNAFFYKNIFNKSQSKHFSFISDKVTSDDEFKKFIEWLNGILLELSLDREIDYNDNQRYCNSKHFYQIRESYPIVKRISENGINLDIQKVKNYLNKKLDEYSNFKDSIDDENLSKLFNAIEKFLKSTSVENSYIESLTENDDELSDNESENENNSQVIYYDEKEFDYTLIKSVFLTLIFSSFNSEHKIFGNFTTHGASTHRMTCKKFNLQGMRKIMRENIFLPSKKDGSRMLYSADVSGQDLVVAISLAKRFYNSKKNREKVKECNRIIKQIQKINYEGINIDSNYELRGITNWLAYESYKKLEDMLENDNEKESYYPRIFITDTIKFDYSIKIFKSVVKKFFYTKLYGGSKKTVIKSIIPNIKKINTNINQCVNDNDAQNYYLTNLS